MKNYIEVIFNSLLSFVNERSASITNEIWIAYDKMKGYRISPEARMNYINLSEYREFIIDGVAIISNDDIIEENDVIWLSDKNILVINIKINFDDIDDTIQNLYIIMTQIFKYNVFIGYPDTKTDIIDMLHIYIPILLCCKKFGSVAVSNSVFALSNIKSIIYIDEGTESQYSEAVNKVMKEILSYQFDDKTYDPNCIYKTFNNVCK